MVSLTVLRERWLAPLLVVALAAMLLPGIGLATSAATAPDDGNDVEGGKKTIAITSACADDGTGNGIVTVDGYAPHSDVAFYVTLPGQPEQKMQDGQGDFDVDQFFDATYTVAAGETVTARVGSKNGNKTFAGPKSVTVPTECDVPNDVEGGKKTIALSSACADDSTGNGIVTVDGYAPHSDVAFYVTLPGQAEQKMQDGQGGFDVDQFFDATYTVAAGETVTARVGSKNGNKTFAGPKSVTVPTECGVPPAPEDLTLTLEACLVPTATGLASRGTVTNPNDTPVEVTFSGTDVTSVNGSSTGGARTVTLAPGESTVVFSTTTVGGTITMTYGDDQSSSAVVTDDCGADFDGQFTVGCTDDAGTVTATVTNTGRATTATLSLDGAASDSTTVDVPAGTPDSPSSVDLVLTDVSDGTVTAQLEIADEVVGSQQVTIDCNDATGSVNAVECAPDGGTVTATVDNTGNDATTATLTLTDTTDSSNVITITEDVAADGTTTLELDGLADGVDDAQLDIADGQTITEQVTVDCDDASGSIAQEVACTDTGGTFTATVDNAGGPATTATLTLTDATDDSIVVTVEDAAIAANDTSTITLDGLPDGIYDVEIAVDGEDEPYRSTATVDCGDAVGSLAQETACVEGDGQFTATIDNAGGDAFEAVLSVTDGTTTFTETVEVGANATGVTITVGELPNGTYDVTLGDGSDTPLAEATGVTVDCVEPTEPAEPGIEVVKTNDANGDGVFTDGFTAAEEAPAPGSDVPFRLEVTNTGDVAGTLTLIDVFGTTTLDLLDGAAPDATCVRDDATAFDVGDVLAAGETVTCTFTLPGYSPAGGTDLDNTVTATLVVDGDPAATATDDSRVTSTEVLGVVDERDPDTSTPVTTDGDSPEGAPAADDTPEETPAPTVRGGSDLPVTGAGTPRALALAIALLTLGVLLVRRGSRGPASTA